MGSLQLHCLGTGDGWPCADRAHSAFLYQFPKATLLLDCGEPVTRTLRTLGLGSDRIDRIFLSHLHFDHLGGFFMLVQGLWLEARRRALPVHLPADGVAPVRRMLDAGCVFHDLLPFRLSLEALKAQRSIVTRGVKVTPYANTHLHRLRGWFQAKYQQAFEAFSFLLEGDGLRVAHSADVGAVEDLALLLRRPVDLLVCELAHFEVEPLTAFLRRQPVKRILFIHLARALWEDVATTRRRLKGGLGGIPFAIARDGERVTVRASASR